MATLRDAEKAANETLRLVILQRVCPFYRIPLFQALCGTPGIDATLLIGDDLPNSKVKSSPELPAIRVNKLRTWFMNLGARTFVLHLGLIQELKRLHPDVILCEGESHFLGYLQAFLYRFLFNKRVALLHWCFISLPGQPQGGSRFRSMIKGFFRRYFDAFVVYSSFSKESLLKLGEPGNKIFVATNVGDTFLYRKLSDAIHETKSMARTNLKLPERFTVLYLGTLDTVKRPELMLDLARSCDQNSYNFVLLGDGPLLEELRKRTSAENLSNVFLPGRIVEQLPLYCRAADVLLVPGRGGIVISEAMAFGLPTIVHQADGTEYDLVEDGVTGIRVTNGMTEDFLEAIEFLRKNPKRCQEMGSKCRQVMASHFTIPHMVEQIRQAAYFAINQRNG